MPARSGTPAQPPYLQSLISSTTYPQPFTLDQLEILRNEIQSRRTVSHGRLVALDPSEKERMKQEKTERKKREKERLAREAEEAEKRAMAVVLDSPRGGVKVKRERTSLSPAASITSLTSGRPSAPITYGSQMKKKKNRVVDSDDEGQARDRSATLASPPHHITTSGLKVKLPHGNNKSRPSFPSALDAPGTPSTPLAGPSTLSANIDFSLPTPATRSLVPPRPGVQAPLPPGPKKQSEVDEDYSNVKAPTQVAFPTFWTGVEPYVRDIREDDLAMLGFKADVSDLYDIPARGRHYSDVWDEEDGNPPGTTPRISVPNLRSLNGTYPPNISVPPWIPSQDLKEENLLEELRGMGNVTERVVAAVMGFPQDESVHGKMAREYEGKEAGKVDARELEEKVKKELRAVMLLGEHEDFDSNRREDDEITAALRSCQRLLLHQTTLNDARKLRLAERAKHRLAYAEYQNALGGVESNIEENWAKRTKKHGHGTSKKHSSSSSRDSRPPVSEMLKQLVKVRKNWVDSVGVRMAEKPRGELVGLPSESVFGGIGEGDVGEQEDEEKVEGVVGMEVDEE